MCEYISVKNICDLLGVTRATVIKLINSGQIKAIRIGNNYKIKQTDFNEFLTNSQVN